MLQQPSELERRIAFWEDASCGKKQRARVRIQMRFDIILLLQFLIMSQENKDYISNSPLQKQSEKEAESQSKDNKQIQNQHQEPFLIKRVMSSKSQAVLQQKQQVKQPKKRRMQRKSKSKLSTLKLSQQMQPQINDPNFQWDQSEDFVVERIIGQQTWNGKKYYLIKWKGFDITLSTWQQADKFSTMYDLIEDFKKTYQGKRDKNIRQSANIMMNPYLATDIHGHFLYGDQAQKIIKTFVEIDSDGKKTIYLQVAWKLRKIGKDQFVKLENSILDSDVIFQHNPNLLINFYESSIKLVQKQSIN